MLVNTQTREIDIMRLLIALWRKIWLVIICAVLAGLAAFLFTRFFVTPMYRANVSVYVDNLPEEEANNNYVSTNTLSAAQRLVKTYITFIQSNTVLEQVIEEGDLNMTAAEIRGMMTASSINDTEVFRVYITHSDPQMAAKVANAIADVAPGKIDNWTGTTTKIVDYAKVPTAPSSPNYQRNTLLGVLIGIIASIVIISLITILDVRIESEEELEQMFEWPVLGSIPAFNANPKSGGKYARAKYAYTDKKEEEKEKQ